MSADVTRKAFYLQILDGFMNMSFLRCLVNLKKILGIGNTELRRFSEDTAEVLQRVELKLNGFKNENNLLPKIVKNSVTGLTINDLRLLLAPYYPRIAQLEDG